MPLEFLFSKSVRQILDLHPENETRWNQMVEKEQAILFHTQTFAEVFEKIVPKGLEAYVYYVVLDESKRLIAWMPGYISVNKTRLIYGRNHANPAGMRAAKLIFANPFGKKLFPREIPLRDLVLGHDMDEGKFFKDEKADAVEIFRTILNGVRKIANDGQFDSISIRDLHPALVTQLKGLLTEEGFVSRYGNGFALISIERFKNLGDYLEFLMTDPSTGYGRKDIKKLLEGNYVPREILSFLKSKRKGFPELKGANVLEETRHKAVQLSRRQQAKAWLLGNGLDNKMPPNEKGEARAAFLDQVGQILIDERYIADLRYDTAPVTSETIEAVFPLWEMQTQKYGFEHPYITKEWFAKMKDHCLGQTLFQVALWDETPVGFFFVIIHQGIYYSMFCGFDPFVAFSQNLYFNMHVQAFIEAKKWGAHSIALGPGDARMNLAKKRLGASVTSPRTYVNKKGFRLAPHVRWSKLRWLLRRFKIKIGRFEAIAEGQFLDAPTNIDLPPELPPELLAKLDAITPPKA